MNRRDNLDPYLCCGHFAGHDGPCEPSLTREPRRQPPDWLELRELRYFLAVAEEPLPTNVTATDIARAAMGLPVEDCGCAECTPGGPPGPHDPPPPPNPPEAG